MIAEKTQKSVPTYCALCVSRCGARAVVEDGLFLSLAADPSHPTGGALCIKGKAAPELVYHPERLLTPLKRTRPKGDSDPGWQAIGWDEALDTAASRLLDLSRGFGPEAVAFSMASPSTSAISDSMNFIDRLRRAFGSPNLCVSVELCAWGRYFASAYTYGASVPGHYLPDLEHAGCIVFWGYNPSLARLTHATSTVEALGRGARLIVVDPRCVGFAQRADEWLRVRPGTDAALALAITGVMIERGYYDRDFVRDWTNAPLLVRLDNRRLLREEDLLPDGAPHRYVAWDEFSRRTIPYDPDAGYLGATSASLALHGEVELDLVEGRVRCQPVFQLVLDSCRRYPPHVAEGICGVNAAQIERSAELLWTARPVAYYAWSGVEQNDNTTQTARAIAQLYALTGSFDARGGNVLFPSVPVRDVSGAHLLSEQQRAKTLGLSRRPLGPSRWECVTASELYGAVLESDPYRIRGLVGFGSNLLLAHADSQRGRQALRALDFYVHADLFMNPTAELADIVLPVASPFETGALALGFEVSPEARSLIQLRTPLVDPRGESRSDLSIVFDLASRLGLGSDFWGGDIDAAYRYQLEHTGVTLEALRAEPRGVPVALATEYKKYTRPGGSGKLRGFATPSGKVELYSETLQDHGYPPLPEFREPGMSPRSRPELAQRYPLVLTTAKSVWYCESQHRALPSLRKRAPDPELEIHPDAARERAVSAGDWVWLVTPHGKVRARAKLNQNLDPSVVCGQHGWWQACNQIGAPAYDPFAADGANLNLVLRHEPSDPVAGSPPQRAYICNVERCASAFS